MVLLFSLFGSLHAQTYYTAAALNFSGNFATQPQVGSDGAWYTLGSTNGGSGVHASRSVFVGLLWIGERHLTLPLDGVWSGVYHLQVDANGPHPCNTSVLVTH